MTVRQARSSIRSLRWRQILPLLALVVVAGVVLADHSGLAQTYRSPGSAAAKLRSVHATIRRHGCHIRAKARRLPGCQRLIAHASRLARAARAEAPPRPANQGFFAKIFGGPKPSRSANSRGHRYPDGLFSWSDNPRRAARPKPFAGSTYRTLCVRLCDGYYWPINFRVRRSRFGADAERCESSCESPARLFVYANPGGTVENMYDLQGEAYSSLDNAFLYRTEYNPDCRCKPHPWTEEAKLQHEERVIAEQERQDQEREDARHAAARAAQAKAAQARRTPRTPRTRSADTRYDTQPRRRRGLFGFW